MFEKEIEEYEQVRKEYQQKIADKMGRKQWMEYNEILFSAHSCAIEGNSFTVDDTRILREQGMAMIPVGRSLLECTEMADHFRAFDYMVSNLEHPFDEALLKEVNRLVTEHTLAYRAQGAIAGEYTTEDMAAGDTVFGDHETLIARVPNLMASTQKTVDSIRWLSQPNSMATTSICILSAMAMAEQGACFQTSFCCKPTTRCSSSNSKTVQLTSRPSSRFVLRAPMSTWLHSFSKPPSPA